MGERTPDDVVDAIAAGHALHGRADGIRLYCAAREIAFWAVGDVDDIPGRDLEYALRHHLDAEHPGWGWLSKAADRVAVAPRLDPRRVRR